MKEKVHSFTFRTLVIFFVLSLPCTSPLMAFNCTPIIAGLLFINWLLWGHFSDKWHLMRQSKYWIPILVSFLFYISYVYGIFICKPHSYEELFQKLPFLILPPALLLNPSFDFTSTFLKKTLSAYIIGCLLSFAILFTHAFLMNYPNEFNFVSFTYSRLSWFHHPTYITLMYIFAIFAALELLVHDNRFSIFNLFNILAIVILPIALVLLNTRGGLLTFGFILFFYTTYAIVMKYKKRLFILSLTTTIALIFISAFFLIPKQNNRIIVTQKIISKKIKTPDDKSHIAPRWHAWQSAWIIGKQYFPKGTGIASLREKQQDFYAKQQYTIALEKNLNTHNQYLQAFAAMGIIGCISLFLLLSTPIYFGLKEKNILPLILCIILTINIINESILERQVGLMFYSFFYSWLILISYTLKNQSLCKKL